MTSLKIKFRKSTIKNKEGVLYFQLIHKRKAKLITTCFRLFPEEWNDRLSTVTDSPDKERNLYLQNVKERLKEEIQKIFDLVFILEKQGDYTIKELGEYYTSNSFNGYLFPFVKYQIKKLKTENRTKTALIYETALRSFSKFKLGEDIRIDKIDGALMQRYENYLKNNNVCNNSISCYMRALRAIYNQAVQKGLCISKYPFRNVYTGVDKTSKRAVNEDIITSLRQFDLTEHSNLEFARDLFLFSFYTRGMSFVDMANLRQCNLKNGYLSYFRSKTKQYLSIKIEKCIQNIIEKYKSLAIEDYILPIYSIQNLDYTSHLRTYNKRLKRLSEILRLEKPLSSYVSRHSWATIAFHKGISIQVISEGMGHENEKTTKIYLASINQSVIDEANSQIIAF
ncbi:MAG: site-specific integrase [Tannerellaceae bacterium]|nr:site-specific integrase [Tannerellaceae bacterium]